MGDILKNISGGWPFLVAWVLPSGLFWSVFALFVLPSATDLPVLREISATPAANQTLVLAGASILTGLVLNALSTVMYRILEGYYLPRTGKAGTASMWKRLTERQVRAQQRLRARLVELEEREPNSLEAGLVREQLQRYPAELSQYGPTRFANAMRAFETYGWNRYRLDSQTLWSELMSVAPEGLRAEQESARTPVDFSVSMVFLSVLTTLTCIGGLVGSGWSASLVTVGVLGLVLAPLWYRLAVLNTRYMNGVVRALVNVSRVDLAKKMGLVLPGTLREEREMWDDLFFMIDEPFDEQYVRQLDEYRVPPAVTPDESPSSQSFAVEVRPTAPGPLAGALSSAEKKGVEAEQNASQAEAGGEAAHDATSSIRLSEVPTEVVSAPYGQSIVQHPASTGRPRGGLEAR